MAESFEQPQELLTSRGERIYSGNIYDDVSAIAELLNNYIALPEGKLQFKLVSNGSSFYAAMQARTHQEIVSQLKSLGIQVNNAVHVEATDSNGDITISLTAQENDGMLYNFIRLYRGIFESLQKATKAAGINNPTILIYCSPHMSMPIEFKLSEINDFSDVIRRYTNFPGRYMHLAS